MSRSPGAIGPNDEERGRPRRAVVTGGAGFVGSHLCDRLVSEGWDVLCVDSLVTGRSENLSNVSSHERFHLHDADVSKELEVSGPVDWIFHLASLASPRDYLAKPIETLEVGALGTLNCLRLAERTSAGLVLASTSEVYGDPLVHPQPESYWGNVNPIGPRSVYDESKRFAEAAAMAFRRVHGTPVRIVRIFNTYGPRMRPDDGRAVPTFIRQALRGEPITVHGDGSQTRSLCYVSDLVEGILRAVEADLPGPVNLGGTDEITMRQLAGLVRELVGSDAPIRYEDRPEDDPERRRPDTRLAHELLEWRPVVGLREGLTRTIDPMRETVARAPGPAPDPARARPLED